MKMRKYVYMLSAALLLFVLPSCFQDLDQDPPFNYPEEPPKPPISEDGQIFYLSFEDNFEDNVSNTAATIVGNPGFTEGKVAKAYAGVQDGYLTFRLSDLASDLGADLTVGFWYKVNANPDRAGIIVIGPVTEGASPEAQNNRTSGFRIFREKGDENNTVQRIKANVGNGTGDGWLDGGANADIPATAGWKYITLTLTAGKAVLYLDGEEVATNDLSQISWAGCDILSIGSGAPRFTEWGHLSDNSLIDELRIYNRALTAAQIKDIIIHDSE
ncbi:LamG domain-containing protein [uncultured Proteiniphilum sp.]|uniref:LamG domain-containing protein n=1 Tax=uncultured Proteiniphilum sp. TaxID=497637 RepID=UPI00261D8BEE|nr:LamG domain-containing protein [uncultured Proteiniphilum sp.]